MSRDRVCVGAIAGSYGVRGEVRLKSFCADPRAIADYGTLFSEDGARNFTVTLGNAVKNGFSARLSGVSGKEEADKLRGTRLYADRSKLPAPEEDEFYQADLLGLPVHDTGGSLIGKVKAVLNHGAGDILELDLAGRPGTALLPFTRAAVPTVDITLGRIVADPPAGVLPET